MFFDRRSTSCLSSPLLPAVTSLGEVVSPAPQSDGEVEQDQLAFTIKALSRPQLQLFETVFITGKSLSAYCEDDLLWSLLAAVASRGPIKTCSLGKILRYRYFARRCNQDLAYSHRFLELQGTPAQHVTWGIPLDVWHRYNAALHDRTSSTSTLLELNMLDEQDEVAADQQELQRFLALQQDEASVAAKRKRVHSPLPSTKKVHLEASKKRPHPAPRASPSQMEVPHRDLPMQGPSDLARLAAVAEAQSSLVQQAVSSPPVRTPIKGAGQDLLSSNMPPTPRPTLVPCTYTVHPYRAENQRLAARVRSLESQLADSQWENSSLTSALRNTSHALES
ncbi:uncharacterized protein C8R40DRAFT_1169852 [Lentinula edodes]|uniref:uncharacterized protein n=1 Tax=Lentinula edodes TaxID=5353 RepID=UPI001E8D240D|nr:uncharacterized protein C8R40DRAFT_1169852 [Lentinula edodes]KAH7876187.1 hypothetical protein C8R40DRAFT_1169852 [Lentinula edodes]